MTAKSEFKVSMEDRKQTYVIIPAYNEFLLMTDPVMVLWMF